MMSYVVCLGVRVCLFGTIATLMMKKGWKKKRPLVGGKEGGLGIFFTHTSQSTGALGLYSYIKFYSFSSPVVPEIPNNSDHGLSYNQVALCIYQDQLSRSVTKIIIYCQDQVSRSGIKISYYQEDQFDTAPQVKSFIN